MSSTLDSRTYSEPRGAAVGSEQHSGKRRYNRDLLIALLAYGILLAASGYIVDANREAGWRYAVALLPMVPAAFVAVAWVRYYRTVDELQQRIAAETNAPLLGQTLEVLVEGRERGAWKGRTRTDKLGFFGDEEHDYTGRLLPLRITRTGPWSLQGTPA